MNGDIVANPTLRCAKGDDRSRLLAKQRGLECCTAWGAWHKKRTRNRAKSTAKMAVHRSGAQANDKIVIVRGARKSKELTLGFLIKLDKARHPSK
jgi:hypothetical protein